MIECIVILCVFFCISALALAVQVYTIIKQKEKIVWFSPIILLILHIITIVAYLFFTTTMLPTTAIDTILYSIVKHGFAICIPMTAIETLLMIISSICLKITLKNNRKIIPENNQKIIEEIEKNA